jgi:hypothetical protein
MILHCSNDDTDSGAAPSGGELAAPQTGAKGVHLVDLPGPGENERRNARDLQIAARQAIAARRQRPADELAIRRRQIEDQRAAFLAAVPPEDTVERIAAQLRRAAEAGEMIAHVFRFPSEYCSDGGRSINNEEHDWPGSLQGLARAHFDLLYREFTPLGFHIAAQIVTWPMLMPGDVSLIMSWRE